MAVPYTILYFLIITTTVVFGWRIRSRRQQQSDSGPSYSDEKPLSPSRQDSSPTIEPLPSFDWENEEPLQLRPFKPIYHITMGMHITSPCPSPLLAGTAKSSLPTTLRRNNTLVGWGDLVDLLSNFFR